MHRNILGCSFVTLELHHDADARSMQVAHQLCAGPKPLEATETHVLADLADQAFADILQRGAEAVLLQGQRTQRHGVRRVVTCDQGGRGIGQRQKTVVLGDKVGFAVDLEEPGQIAFAIQHNHAFGSHAPGGFAGLGAELHPQQLLRPDHVAFGFAESPLALHHRRIGLCAQLRDHARTDCSHLVSPSLIQQNSI